MQMFSRETMRLLSLFTVLFLTGLVLANPVIMAMSLVPLFTLLLGLLVKRPDDVEVTEVEKAKLSWAGEDRPLVFDVTVKDGMGFVAVAQRLPGNFELVESSNFGLYWKGRGEKRFRLSFKVRCTKRGVYTMPRAEWEAKHPLDLTPVKRQSGGSYLPMTVRPKIMNVRRIRAMPGLASKPFPEMDVARIGLASTDFREIRDYVYGDPIKSINWKATARRERGGVSWPLVNEYEAEGKKAVWIFLDAASYLDIGTPTESVFECAIEAANAIAFYFLDRGYRVGMYVYNDGERLFYPDAGKRQFHRLTRELIDLKTSTRLDELPQAVEKCRKFILAHNALCVIVTRLDTRHAGLLVDATRKIMAIGSRWRRRRLPVMVVGIAGSELVPGKTGYEENTADFLRLQGRHVAGSLRHLGASVLEWNPQREGFAVALLRQVRTR